MKLTQGQALELAGLSRETLRHWKLALTVLSNRKGRSQQFSCGDALALSVISRLTRDLELPVSKLDPVADELFSLCQGVNWGKLVEAVLVIDLDKSSVRICQSRVTFVGRSTIVLKVDDLVSNLQAKLVEVDQSHSRELLFRPMGVVGGRMK